MARGVNKVTIVGNLGQDPEVHHTASGSVITKIAVATTEAWTDKASGQKQERTEWHRITLFNKMGEIAAEYLKKGSQVYIEGSIRTDKYTDKAGVEKYSTGIVARDMQLLGGNPNAQQAPQQAPQQRPVQQTAAQPQQSNNPAIADVQSGFPVEFDDESQSLRHLLQLRSNEIHLDENKATANSQESNLQGTL